MTPAPSVYLDKQPIEFTCGTSFTGGATTLNIQAIGAKAVYSSFDGNNPAPNDCLAGQSVWATYSATANKGSGAFIIRDPVNHAKVLNVMTFGCVGDGIADDTSCLQNALAALPAVGGRLFWPCGTYLISSGLTTGIKSGFFLEGAGAAGWANTSYECARIVTSSPIIMLSLGNGTNQLTGGIIQGLSFIDIGNAGAGQTATIGIYVSDSYTTIRNCSFNAVVNAVKYDGGSYYQNANRFENNQVRNVQTAVSVTGLSDGPILSGNYMTTTSTTAGNVCLDIQGGGTATSVKSIDDNCVVNTAAVGSGVIASASRAGSATVTVTTIANLPAAFISNGYVTITGCSVAAYNVTNALATVAGANTFAYQSSASATDSATGCTINEKYGVGVRIGNAHNNIITGMKIEFQPGCCVGSAIEVQAGSNRNQIIAAISKAVTSLLLDPGALGVLASLEVDNTTNIDPIDNSSGSSAVDVVTTTTAYRVVSGGAKFFGGTGFPPPGQCTAATAGGLYMRNNAGAGTVYVCTAAGTWTALTIP
jgi:hypothetical protein